MAREGTDNKYVAGVCNIGSYEKRRRSSAAILGAFLFVAVWGFLMLLSIPRIYYIFLFFPAFPALYAYMEYSLGFCAYFGSKGIYNFGEQGDERRVSGATNRKKDALRSSQIMLASFSISLIIAFLFATFPL